MRITAKGLPDRRNTRLIELASLRHKHNPAIFRAITDGSRSMVAALLKAGACLSVRNAAGQTVLVAALHIDNDRKRLSIVRKLLFRGANPVNCDVAYGRDAVGWAAALCRIPECELILTHFLGEVNLTRYDAESKTPIHLAVEAGCLDIVSMLVKAFRKYSLSVDVRDGLGLTPLMHAQRLAFTDIVKTLIFDGRACPFHRDPVKYMNAMEWHREGILERIKNIQREFSEKDERDRILGRVLRPLVIPRVNITDCLNKNSERSGYMDNNYASMESLTRDEFVDSQRDVVDNFNTISFRSLDVPSLKLLDAQTIRSLIAMSSEHGVIPTHFHGSRSRNVVGGRTCAVALNTSEMLGILADQKTSSFRMPYKNKIIPEIQETSTVKPKVSSLAIIMGKQKRGNAKNNSSTTLKVPVKSGRKKTPETKRMQKVSL